MVVILGLRTELLQVLAESEYAASEAVVPVLLFVPLGIVLAVPSNLILRLQEKTKMVAVINIVGMVINVLLNVLLIPEYAMLGAAWASAISFGTVMVLGYLSVRRSQIISFRSSKVPQLLLINIVLYVLVYGARHLLQIGGHHLGLPMTFLVLGGGGLLAYSILVLLFRVVSIEEFGRLRTLLEGISG
jgi:O-antigen/teichoic acid export membrane protein